MRSFAFTVLSPVLSLVLSLTNRRAGLARLSFASLAAFFSLQTGFWPSFARGEDVSRDYLVKFSSNGAANRFASRLHAGGAKTESLGDSSGVNQWLRMRFPENATPSAALEQLRQNPRVEYIQPNYKIRIYENYQTNDVELRAALQKLLLARTALAAAADNPPIPPRGNGGSGDDPLFSKQWGMNDIGVQRGWGKNTSHAPVIVAVLDTGVDYTHEDLVDQLWRNPGESGVDAQGRDKATNGVDDDGNGFVDDVIGWDFATNDNKPFDLAVDPIQILLGGGNPGHGTHCAGNVAARLGNGKGVAGVAPEAKIMALRFLSEKGEGTTADALKAINYAVKNGAKVLSNSWGSEGEDPKEGQENQALKDAITAAQSSGVLFIAAAGNGHQGVGYDNDADAKPGVPASYDMENIISVAAIDANNALGSFSNWGRRTVDIAAPGVKIFSTTVGNHYSDMVIDLFGLQVGWDGTSMATPHVAGAAALYWSAHPSATWRDVKAAIMDSATPVAALNGRLVTGGKLNVDAMMNK